MCRRWVAIQGFNLVDRTTLWGYGCGFEKVRVREGPAWVMWSCCREKSELLKDLGYDLLFIEIYVLFMDVPSSSLNSNASKSSPSMRLSAS
jgi:hypothetical protein